MSVIQTFNSAVSNAVNKEGEVYTVLIGKEDFTPNPDVKESSDFNCGALCNELEYLRKVSNYFTLSFDLNVAEDDNLDTLITTFLNLPRRGAGEPNTTYRERYRTIAVQNSNQRRTTTWAITDALKHILGTAKVQIIEKFDSDNMYFQVRINGSQNFDDVIFMNHPQQAYIDQGVVGGEGIGGVISYVEELLKRITASGVDFDILFIHQESFTKLSLARVV